MQLIITIFIWYHCVHLYSVVLLVKVRCTYFQRFHSCVDLRRQNVRSHEGLISGRNHEKYQSNKPTNKLTGSNKENMKPSEEETTLTEQSNYSPVSGEKKAATFNTSMPSTMKVPKINNSIKVKTVNDIV